MIARTLLALALSAPAIAWADDPAPEAPADTPTGTTAPEPAEAPAEAPTPTETAADTPAETPAESAAAAEAEPPTDPCSGLDGMPEGPVTAGLRNGDLGRGHRVCTRNEVSIGPGAYLLADSANFYGHIVVNATVAGSYAFDERTEIFATLEIVRWDSVLAPFPDDYLGPGFATIGASTRLFASEKTAIALNGKVVFPSMYKRAWPLGIDLGLAGVYAVSRSVRLHAQLSGEFEANLGQGPTLPAFGFAPTVGVMWRPKTVFAMGLDAIASLGLTSAVDYFALSPAFRFSDGKRFGCDFGITIPLAGEERALAAVDLMFSVRM